MSLVNEDDEKLVAEYISSENEDIFQILLNKYTNMVYNFVRHMTKNATEAEDITQEVFIKVWKKIKKYHF